MLDMKKSLCLLFVLVFASCNADADASYNETQLTKEIEARIDAFVDHNNKLEVQELKAFYSNDERFYWVEDGQVQYPSKGVLITSLEGLVGMVSTVDMKILNRRIQVLSANSAMIFLEYEQAMTMASGGGFSIDGAMTVMLQKEEGIWRFLMGHSSTKKERGG